MPPSIEVICTRIDEYMSYLPASLSTHVNPSVSLLGIHRFAESAKTGARLAIAGVSRGATTQQVRVALKRSILCFIASSAMLFVGLFLAFLPFRLFFALCSFLFTYTPAFQSLLDSYLSASDWLVWSSNTIAPSVILFCYTNIFLYDDCFFAILRENDAGCELEKQLRTVAPPSIWSASKKYLQRLLPVLCVGVLVTFLQSLPFIHRFIPSLWLLKLLQKSGAMDPSRSGAARVGILVTLFAIACSHCLSSLCYQAFTLYLATCGLSRELFGTYLCRLDGDVYTFNKKQHQLKNDEENRVESDGQLLRERHANSPSASRSPAPLSLNQKIGVDFPHESAREFVSLHGATLFGVGSVFILPASVSNLAALFVAPLAHAAAGYTLLHIVLEKQRDEMMIDSPIVAAADVPQSNQEQEQVNPPSYEQVQAESHAVVPELSSVPELPPPAFPSPQPEARQDVEQVVAEPGPAEEFPKVQQEEEDDEEGFVHVNASP